MAETKFTPTQNFYSEELGSQYVEGLTYTIRDQRGINGGGEEIICPAEETLLAKLAKGWLAEGLIVLVPSAAAAHMAASAGRLKGMGMVTNSKEN